MRKLTEAQNDKLVDLVQAFAEDHVRYVMVLKENPDSVNWAKELINAATLGMAITNYVDSLL